MTSIITKSNLENNVLASIRDILLPKLLSGKMSIQDVDKFLREKGIENL